MNKLSKEVSNTKISMETVKKYLAPTASDQDLMLFVELCRSQNLNPFIKEAYLISYKTKYGVKTSIVTAKDVFTKRAQKQSDFDGFKAGVILMRDNNIVYQTGSFKLKNDKILGGWAEVRRKKVDYAFRCEVSMDEYTTGKSMWETKPLTMIRKVALVHALREAYPSEFSGMYDESEISKIENLDSANYKDEESEDVDEMPTVIIEEKKEEVSNDNDYTKKENEIIDMPTDKFYCEKCNIEITESVNSYSQNKYKKPLCFNHQKEV